MRKILFLLLSVCFFSANAQINLTRNFTKLYVSYQNMGAYDLPGTDDGFLAGVSRSVNIYDQPAFVEIGAEYQYFTSKEQGLKESIHMINVPLSLSYAIGNDVLVLAPSAGFDFHFNLDWSVSEYGHYYSGSKLLNTFQPGWHVGGNIYIGNFFVGYKFTGFFTGCIESVESKNYIHSVVAGVRF